MPVSAISPLTWDGIDVGTVQDGELGLQRYRAISARGPVAEESVRRPILRREFFCFRQAESASFLCSFHFELRAHPLAFSSAERNNRRLLRRFGFITLTDSSSALSFCPAGTRHPFRDIIGTRKHPRFDIARQSYALQCDDSAWGEDGMSTAGRTEYPRPPRPLAVPQVSGAGFGSSPSSIRSDLYETQWPKFDLVRHFLGVRLSRPYEMAELLLISRSNGGRTG